jgi:hypothetical protein
MPKAERDAVHRATEKREAEWRRVVDNRPDRPADWVGEAVASAVLDSITDGSFRDRLAERGWALVHVGDGGCPEPPSEWLHDALDLALPGWKDPIERIDELWKSAFETGRLTGRAEQ